MRAPEFWTRRDWRSAALLPLARLMDHLGQRRQEHAPPPMQASIPVICVGNLVAGGAGKTPVVMALARFLAEHGVTPHILSRGYGGNLAGPILVDPGRHDYRAIGDEPLLLAALAPVWVAKDRPAGAAAAIAAAAPLLLMDDGLQNPSLVKDLSLIVVDGGYGFGNGRVLPAGPLRESLDSGLARADAAILIGQDRTGVAAVLDRYLPVIEARLVPRPQPELWPGRPILAFAGIGRPQKFFDSLRELGTPPLDTVSFPDHHPYRERDMTLLLARAKALKAALVTTAKDWVRIPPRFRPGIITLEIDLVWLNPIDHRAIQGLILPLIPGESSALGA